MAKKPTSATTADKLRSFRDRIVNLEQEKKQLSADIKDIYAEAKNDGFDMKALRRVVKDTMMDQTQRAAQRETETIADLYRASLGMLDGTPLGDAARRRYEEDRGDAADRDAKASDDDAGADADGVVEDNMPEPDTETLEQEARDLGRADHAVGKSILENPFAANDFRRAAWDEGWCDADGSDGMDPPDAWRRRPSTPDQPGREA